MPNLDALFSDFIVVRQCTEFLCQNLLLEDYHLQPVADVSPAKWHLAHTSWFFEQFILQDVQNYTCFHPQYNYLFNSYYESVGKRWDRAARGDLSRPAVETIYQYRAHVQEAIAAALPRFSERQLQLLQLGMHHEQQHQELLLTDLKYSLGLNPLFPALQTKAAKPSLLRHRADGEHKISENWFEIPAGVYWVGFSEAEPFKAEPSLSVDFSFDNERGAHRVFINPCEIATQTVTQREYLAFLEAGGYTRPEFWLSDGWDWCQREQIQAPLHWHFQDNAWWNYTLSGLQPLDLDAPVTHLSFFEADAYARFCGARLPTEFEWEVAVQLLQPQNPFTEAQHSPFLESGYWQPVPYGGFWGNVWEWTASAYLPYPGFEVAEGAVGEYNGKFMNGQYVLRGGSCATPHAHIRATYRNFFMPEKRWQFTGLRLARSLKEKSC